MKKSTLIIAALILQGCVVHTPAVSSNLLEASETKGNLIHINGENCGVVCERMMMQQAQQVCANGYTILNTSIPNFKTANMVVRCQKGESSNN